MQTKVCTSCGVEKPLYNFYKEKEGKYGVKGKCCSCVDEVKRQYRAKKRQEKAIGSTCCYCNQKIVRINSTFIEKSMGKPVYAHTGCCNIREEIKKRDKAKRELRYKNKLKKFYKWLDKTGNLDVITPMRFVSEDELRFMSNGRNVFRYGNTVIYSIPLRSYSFYERDVGFIQMEGFYRVEKNDGYPRFLQYYNGGYPSDRTDLFKYFLDDMNEDIESGKRISTIARIKRRDLEREIEIAREKSNKRLDKQREWNQQKRAEERFFAGLALAGGKV